MPFSLFNALANFQCYINKIIAEKLDIFVVVYLDDILIYIEDSGWPYVDAVWWILEQLQKHGFYANLKKCQSHQDEVRFLGFVVTAQGIRIEEETIKAVKAWPEPPSVRDIEVFLDFANFYRRFIWNFIWNFSRIAASLTSMLQKTDNEVLSTQAIGNKKNQDAPSAASGASGGGVGGSFENLSTIAISAKSKKSKSKANFAKANSGTDFLIPGAKEAFIHLQKAFTKALILRHFDPECHIRIETDALGYAIGGVLS